MRSLKYLCAAACLVGTVGNAQTLKEMLKSENFLNANISGFAKLKNDTTKIKGTDVSDNENNLYLYINADVPVAQDLDLRVGFGTAGRPASNKTTNSYVDSEYGIRSLYFTYKKEKLNIKVGQQALGMPVTDNELEGQLGNGVIATYTANENFSFVASHFGGVDMTGIGLTEPVPGFYPGRDSIFNYSLPKEADKASVSALAAKADFGAVKAQVWGIRAPGFIDSMMYAQLNAEAGVFALEGQYIRTKLADKLTAMPAHEPTLAPGETGDFFALEATAKFEFVDVMAGYSKNDDKQGIYSFAGAYAQRSEQKMQSGLRLEYEIDNKPGAQAHWLSAHGYFGDIMARVGYAKAELKNESKDLTELWAGLAYMFSKDTMGLITYSDINDSDNGATTSRDQSVLTFELKYNF